MIDTKEIRMRPDKFVAHKELEIEERKKLILLLCDSHDQLERKLKIAENLLHELHVMVWGECPQLLNEDSGGDADLDFKIDEALKQIRGE